MLNSIGNYISTTSCQAYEALPSAGQMARNVSQVALPLVTVAALASLPSVSASGSYTECIEFCDAWPDSHPAGVLACYALCALLSIFGGGG